ncbi:hypothetical protein [Nesterenkonia haasae]|uniref:hypothetical protein n=1 Tax=Nesterenkonia haasae TaxID=2587813 RepID=UPI001390FF33|nr:hypothetical protein [Nesterenkonia haasae]
MPALTTVPDADRPIGKFIVDSVLPRWDSINTFRHAFPHSRMMTVMLQRRRVHVHQFKGIVAAFLYNGDIVGGRTGRLTTLVSDQALEACNSKSLAREYFTAAEVPVPRGQVFTSDQQKAAAAFVSKPGPWVLKPDEGRHGRGVRFGVTEETLDTSWTATLSSIPRTAEGPKQLLIDQFRDALCLRFYVVGSAVQAVAVRVPAFVVGDGTRPISTLLTESFAAREAHPLLRKTLPQIGDNLLNSTDWSLDQVPAAGELALLGTDGSMTRGGVPVDVTDEVSSELNDLAVRAADSIPGLVAAGIDILAPELNSAQDAVVLDADAWANTTIHRYPALGRPRRAGATAVAEHIRLRAAHWDKPALPPEPQDPDDD